MDDYAKIEHLYGLSFPKYERIPLNSVLKKTQTGVLDFWAFYDNDILCAIAILSNTQSATLVAYLAVSPEVRSKGYGSAILQKIKEEKTDKTVYVIMDSIDNDRSPIGKRRKKFYLKNVFFDTEYFIVNPYPEYTIDVMATSNEVDIGIIDELLCNLSDNPPKAEIKRRMKNEGYTM